MARRREPTVADASRVIKALTGTGYWEDFNSGAALNGDADLKGGITINAFSLLAAEIGKIGGLSVDTLNTIFAFAEPHNHVAGFEVATGVPESTSLGMLNGGAVLGLRRRRR